MFLYTTTIQTTYPHKTGELLAYMATIVQTSTTYPTEACLSYDRVFRAQAHLKPYFNRASDNNRLWNEKFSGRAVPKPCGHCTSIPMERPQLPSEQPHAPTALPRPLPSKHHTKRENYAWVLIWGTVLSLCVPDHTSVTGVICLILHSSARALGVS